MIVLSWNICGLGNEKTQAVLENLCNTHKPDWVALYEPKILMEHLPHHFLRKLNLVFLANINQPTSRPNIWVLCKPDLQASLVIVSTSDQYVAIRHSNTSLVFVHASNNYNHHRLLWSNLLGIDDPNTSSWVTLILSHERSSGRITHATPSDEFKNFIAQRDLFDIEGTGNKFTWATRRNSGYMAAHLDRALASQGFLNLWDDVELLILPMLCSDHSPLRLQAARKITTSPRLLRFQNMWTLHEQFHAMVKDNWYIPLPASNPTLCLIAKLKCLRGKLRTWNLESFRNIHTEIQRESAILDQIQQRISIDGDSDNLFLNEMNQTSKVNGLLARRHALISKKNCLQWLKDGERNSSFFHRLHSTNKSRASIKMVQVGDYFITLDSAIGQHVVFYYQQLFSRDTNLLSDFSFLNHFN